MVVNKSEQLLLIYRHDERGNVWLDKILPCSTGMVRGDKLIRGDKKTPEGYYVFRQKLLPQEVPDIYGILAYPMDYPNFWDRKVGRGGDGIWTHGINKPLVDYDSNGCIEVQNHDIAALEDEIKLHDTPILVYDQLSFASKDDLKKEAEDVADFVERWRLAWSEKNIQQYATYYDEDFHNTDELGYKAWMDRKVRVAAGYQKIEVAISDLRIFRHRDTVVASFTQDYKGDARFRSLGYKRLYLKGEVGAWRIVAEEYGPLPAASPEKWLTAQEKNLALTTPPLAVAQLSEPVAAASAGVILPSGSTLVADNTPARAQTEAQAAADEAARAALEERTSRHEVKASEVTVLASLNPKDVNAGVARDTDGVTASPAAAEAGAPAAQAGPAATLSGAAVAQAGPPAGEPASPEAMVPDRSAPLPEADEAPAEPVGTAPTEPAGPGDDEAVLADEPAEPVEPAETAQGTDRDQAYQAVQGEGPGSDEGEGDGDGRPAPDAVVPAGGGLTAEAATSLLNAWLAAWSSKDEGAYFACYAPDFYFKDLSLHLNSFKRYRSRRFQEAGGIKVEAEDVKVTISGDQAVITFIQSYTSDRHGDRGLKTLELGARDGQWLITSEAFTAIP
jgi:murein L,D-transpeptidase YafK